MTFRQVKIFLSHIGHASMVEYYNQIVSYRAAQAKNLPSLEEFLSLASREEPKSFDESADKFLEEQALKRLHERKREYGG